MSVDEKTVKYAKLEWYKEVLSLEPNSKLFLPLARLLAELGTEDNNADMMNEAFEVLRRGLNIQPEFMEARLFLIELLNACGCKAQCGAEVARLASLFLSYPDFWDAWREYAITEHESSDFTAALGFMSAIMRNKSLSIVQVLEAGLNSLKTNSAPLFSSEMVNAAKNIEKSGIAKMPQEHFSKIKTCLDGLSAQQENSNAAPFIVPEQTAEQEQMAEEATVEVQEQNQQDTKNFVPPAPADKNFAEENLFDKNLIAEQADTEKPIMPSELADVLPKSHVDNYMNFAEQQNTLVQDKTKSTKETLAELIKDANITIEPVENSLFRTKSMADLLAEQGDYKGALEIYQELLAKGYGNKQELEERIADIKTLAPELDVKIDKSKLLAIDDLVDTSFGTMAESLSTLQAGNFDLNAPQAEDDDLTACLTEKAQDNTQLLDIDEFSQNIQEESPVGSAKSAENLAADEQISAPNTREASGDEALTEEQGVKAEKKSKSQADVADLLTKLAERLEIRAS